MFFNSLIVIFLVISFGSLTAYELPFRKTFSYNNLTVHEKPTSFPRAIPIEFYYNNSILIHSTSTKSENNYYSVVESYVKFKTNNTPISVKEFYFSILKELKWKIIEEKRINNQEFLIAEDEYQTMLTLVFEKGRDTGTIIKLFYKNLDDF